MIKPGVSFVYLTTNEWNTLDPVIPARVTGVDADTGAQKLGDGILKWSELAPNSGRLIGTKAVQTSREPVDNEGLVFCAAEDKYVFRLIGCHLTQLECAGMALDVYPKHSIIIETDNATHIGTGRIKIGDGVTMFGTLPWIGVPASDFAAHLLNFSNPHGVTKDQVGLGNVTDDAQMKRAAGDMNSFDANTVLNDGDVFLIEDSGNSYAKRKITTAEIEDLIIADSIALGG